MKEWKKVEKQLAKKVGGKVMAGSGAPFRTNDVVTSRFSIEVKSRAKSITVSETLLDTVFRKAVKQGRRPALYLAIGRFRVYVFFEDDVQVTDDGFFVG